MNNNQPIPWARISAEAGAIVLSILVAFAIDAWWDKTQEERRLYSTLETLEAGFTEHLQLLSENFAIASASLDLVNNFIEMSPNDVADIPIDIRLPTLRAFLTPNTFTLNIEYLRATLDDESLGLLRNRALLQAIAEWRSWVGQIQERSAVLSANESAAIHVLSNRQQLWPYLSSPGGRLDVPDLSDELLLGIRQDEQIMANFVEKRYSASIHRFYLRNMQTETEQLLTVLRAELAE